VDVVKVLCEHGADKDARNDGNCTTFLDSGDRANISKHHTE
jgi:hypothetical protein